MKKLILLFLSFTLLVSSCKDFLNLTPRNTKVVYTMSDVKQAMSSYLFAFYSCDPHPLGRINITFAGTYIGYPFTRTINTSTILLTNDLELTNFFEQQGSSESYSGEGFRAEYLQNYNWQQYDLGTKTWESVFSNIGYLNMVENDLKKVPDYNKTDHDQILGEIKVMRAYYLLRLNQLFAPYDNVDFGIPFNLDADVFVGSKRWNQKELYKKLIAEITEVMEYETAPKPSWNILFNHRIMCAILAETYHFKAESCAKEADDWSKAEYYAKQARNGERVENTVQEQIELSLLNQTIGTPTLDRTHKFTLLRLNLRDTGPTSDFDAPWGKPQLFLQSPSRELYEMYDENDIRLQAYFTNVDDQIRVVKTKRMDFNFCNCAHVLFRHSEMMLIEAEALQRQNKPGALALLNEFKASKIPGYTGYTGNDILGEIFKERRKEFVYEEQMNWLDMKRLGVKVTRDVLDVTTNAVTSVTLEANDYRYTFPIPATTELQQNNIPQNPGWK